MRPYPLHYLLTRRFSQKLLQRLETAPSENRQRLCAEMIQDDAGPSFGRDHFESYGGEYMLSLHFGEWALFGRETWSLPPEITQAFLHSNIAELRIRDILPAEAGCGYIGFAGRTLRLPGIPGPVEGAFWRKVSFAELSIVFVGRVADGSNDPVTRGLEGYRIPFLFTTFDLPADQAIDRAIEDDIADLDGSRVKFTEPDRLLAVDHAIERHRAAAATLRQAMSLVLNAMAFRKAYPDDTAIEWPPGSPQRMVDQAAHPSSENARERARSKLWHLGWSPITIIGPHVAAELGKLIDADGSRRVHWRSGHWRNQAHGPAMSLRKLIWIWPTIVGASHADGTELADERLKYQSGGEA